MTPKEQRIAIAAACGWYISKDHGEWAKWVNPEYIAPHDPRPDMKGKYGCKNPPDYLNDLNAMAEAEKALTSGQWDDYHRELLNQVRGKGSHPRDISSTHATAAQRAEAFLKILGLWREDCEEAGAKNNEL